MKTKLGVALVAVLTIGATVAPVLTEVAAQQEAPARPLLIIDGVKRPELASMSARGAPKSAEIQDWQLLQPAAAEQRFGPQAKYGAILIYTKKYIANGGKIETAADANSVAPKAVNVEEVNSAVMKELFAGISLTVDASAKARKIIGRERTVQMTIAGPKSASLAKRVGLVSNRDLQLRQLISSEPDRARFDRQAARWSEVEFRTARP
ncbi:MAG: hypothetical protein ABI625_14030 [bacterium]